MHVSGYKRLPVVELVDVQEVSKHDVVFVGKSEGNIGATGHLPQVGLDYIYIYIYIIYIHYRSIHIYQ